MNINQGEPKQESQEKVNSTFGQDIGPKFKNAKEHAKKGIFSAVIFIIVIAILVVLSNSFYIVREDEVATVRELGEIKSVVVDSNTDFCLLYTSRCV